MNGVATARLENWSTGWNTDDGSFCISGLIYGDTKGRFSDGELIRTSRIEAREVKEGDLVQTRNSVYQLGKKI